MIAPLRRQLPNAPRLALAAAILLLLVGCFTSEGEVFSASDAELVPGLEGQYNASDAALTLFRVPETNEYRFILSPKDEKPSSGFFRAMRLGATLVLVAAHLDTDPPKRFDHLLFNLTMSADRVATIQGMEVNEAAAKAEARRLGVRIEGATLIGSKPALMRFLMGLGGLPLTPNPKAVFSRAE